MLNPTWRQKHMELNKEKMERRRAKKSLMLKAQLKNSQIDECNSDLEASCASEEFRKRQESVKIILMAEERRRNQELNRLETLSEEESSRTDSVCH